MEGCRQQVVNVLLNQFGHRLLFTAFVFILIVSFVPALQAQDLKDSVSRRVSPDDWLKGQKEANKEKWDEVDSVSPAMAEILLAAEQSIAEKGDKGVDCDRAAANLAFSVVGDAYGGAALKALLGALKEAASKIISLGEKDIIEKILSMSEQDVVDEVKKLIAEHGKEWLKEKIREKFSKEKPEAYINKTTKSGCSVVLVAIWNKAGGTYEVTVYGNCECMPQLTGDYNRPYARLHYFAVRATGKVSVDIKDNVPIVRAGPATKVTINADCNCEPATEKPSSGTTSPTQTAAAPISPEEACKIKLQCPKPCKECEEIHQKIKKACDRLSEIGTERYGEFGEARGSLDRNKENQDVTKKNKEAARQAKDAAKEAKYDEELKDLEREARELDIKVRRLGLEELRLKQELRNLAQKLKDCEKKCCGPKEPAPKEKTETPSGRPISQPEQKSETASYYLPSGMLTLNPDTAPAWWSSPFAPRGDCPCYCCRCNYGVLIQSNANRPGFVSVRLSLAMDKLGVGRSIHVTFDRGRYAAEAYLQWNASGGSGLAVDLEVQRPGVTTFEKLATGRGPDDVFFFVTRIPGTYLFRATAKDSSGKSSFNTLSVTFPFIDTGAQANPK